MALGLLAIWGGWGGSATPALAAPGDLDTAFGNSGKSIIDLGARETATDVALQPDGKIIVSGSETNFAFNDFDGAVLRVLSPQGTLDTSFAAGVGWKRIDVPGGFTSGVVVQPDGKIAVSGSTTTMSGAGRFLLARLDSAGGFDTSFASPNGFMSSKFGSLAGPNPDDFGVDVAQLPNGSYLVGGQTQDSGSINYAVAQVTNFGNLDLAYGNTAGAEIVDFNGGDDFANSLAVQPDGKALLAGSAERGNSDFGIVRLLPDGNLDSSFGGTGKVRVDFGSNVEGASAIAVQPDGKIVLVGGGFDSVDVARLRPDGALDDGFGNNGRMTFTFGGESSGSGVALQPDGKIIVGGRVNQGTTANPAVARLQPNGTLDTSFGNGGKSVIDFGVLARTRAIALQPDGKIVVAASAGQNNTEDIALARLQGDPPGAVKGRCAGKKATIVGTGAKDKLKGTKKNDVISAGGGNDTVKGLKGNDLICGGKGKDKLVGGPGKDKLLGQQGNDKLFGGPGKDKLKGGPGKKDKLVGGAGKDSEKP